MHDVNILDILEIEAGAIYLVDRGYIDFERLYNINIKKAFFITLAKSNMKFRRVYSHQSDIANGIHSDQTIMLTNPSSRIEYPEKLRRIHFYDVEHLNHLYFLTNNFTYPSGTIAKLYKCRWQIELFFQMDKTAPSNQSFLWDFGECGKVTNLDCNMRICAPGHNQEKVGLQKESLHNFTGCECIII